MPVHEVCASFPVAPQGREDGTFLIFAMLLHRVYLKTPNAPGQRAFLRCAASFFLEIRQYSCKKMSCATQKSLAAGHIMSFQIHPSKKRPAACSGWAVCLLLHQAHAVVIRSGGDEGFVFLEDIVHERNDGVIALRHGFGKGIIVVSRYVALNVRLAGKNLIAA